MLIQGGSIKAPAIRAAFWGGGRETAGERPVRGYNVEAERRRESGPHLSRLDPAWPHSHLQLRAPAQEL